MKAELVNRATRWLQGVTLVKEQPTRQVVADADAIAYMWEPAGDPVYSVNGHYVDQDTFEIMREALEIMREVKAQPELDIGNATS